jgi:hypothetical protein
MKLKMTMLVVSVLAFVGVVSPGFAIQPTGGYDERDRERETYIEREPYDHSPLVIDVWTDRGEGAVFYPGQRIRVYFRASRDCYVTIYNVDTQGYVHLLYPAGSFDEHFIMGGVTYRAPSRRAPYDLVVGGPPGIEYVEAVASAEPFHSRPPWYLDPEYGEWEGSPWALYGSDYEDYAEDYDYYVERGIVRGDPFLAIQSINRRIIPTDYPSSYYATAYTSFYVDRRVSYPRYLCYDCHWDYPTFNPYGAGCVVFDIRIDRTWVYSPRLALHDYRPRYYYSLRQAAPVRYKGERHFWSSKDGLMSLRKEFSVSKPKVGPGAPGFVLGGGERWKEGSGPSGLRKWKAGKEPYAPEKLEGLKKRLESEGMLKQKHYEKEPQPRPEQYQEKNESLKKQESFESGRKEIQQQQGEQQEKERESYQKKEQTRVKEEIEKQKIEKQKTEKQKTQRQKTEKQKTEKKKGKVEEHKTTK